MLVHSLVHSAELIPACKRVIHPKCFCTLVCTKSYKLLELQRSETDRNSKK